MTFICGFSFERAFVDRVDYGPHGEDVLASDLREVRSLREPPLDDAVNVLDRAFLVGGTGLRVVDGALLWREWELFALRRARQGHRLAEEGRDGDPALLWDSTSPRSRRHRVGNAVSAGGLEDVPEACGIAERRFAGRWQEKSPHATENGIF